MWQQRGFTLIELMIVVAIIAIISAITLPNLYRSRLNANESAAIGNLNVVGSAQFTYNTTDGTYGSFATLTADDPPYIDQSWTEGCVKSGYIYTMPVVTVDYFEAYAEPVVLGRSGTRWFRIDATGTIRFSITGQPDDTSTKVGDIE